MSPKQIQFKSFVEWYNYLQETSSPVWGAVLDYETKNFVYTSEAAVFTRLATVLDVQFAAIHSGLTEDRITCSGIIQNGAKRVMSLDIAPLGLSFNKVIAYAMAAKENNACGGLVVGAPTAGASGILPAIFYYMHKDLGFVKEKIYEAMLVAAGVGLIIEKRASISGAHGGCQAETGTAAAMGAAAMVYLYGGTFEQILDAVKTVLINLMGLICDPIAGLVEMPCVQRNSNAVTTSFNAVISALSDVNMSFVSVDDVIDTMDEVGQTMDRRYKETALGGIAVAKMNRKNDDQLRKTTNSVFSIYGPIMVGPSTSHTCGANRIAQFVNEYIGGNISIAYITLYNSFALTAEGHGTDRAIVAGLLGMKEDALELHQSFGIAEKQGFQFHIQKITDAPNFHENTVRVVATGNGKTVEIIGVSTGGGIISIRKIDDYDCDISCQKEVLIVHLEESATLDGVLYSYKVAYPFLSKKREKDYFLLAEADIFPMELIEKIRNCLLVIDYSFIKRICV